MPDWTWAAASVRGTAHADAGDRRQDACRVVATGQGWLVAVACDGAGSTSHGRYGAAIAARILSTRAKSSIASDGLLPSPAAIEDWVEEARELIASVAARIDRVAADFATTMVMAVSDGRSTITAHIGDGAIIARGSDTAILLDLSWPESGDYAATTFFLTDVALHLRIGILDNLPIDRLAVLTDGMERLALAFSTRTAHAPFFDPLFEAVASSGFAGRNGPLSQELAAFLGSDAVNARTDDDKTLILAAFG